MSEKQEKTQSTKKPTKKISGNEMVDCEVLHCDEDSEEGSTVMLAEATKDASGKAAVAFVDAAAMKRLEEKVLKLEERNHLVNAKLTEMVESIAKLNDRVRGQTIQGDNIRCMLIKHSHSFHDIRDEGYKAKREIESLQHENDMRKVGVHNCVEVLEEIKSDISDLQKAVDKLQLA